MSVIRPKPPEDPIAVASAAATQADGTRFEAARPACLDDPVFLQPARLLAAYHADRPTSELFVLLATARKIRETVDRVVLVAAAATHEAVRLLMSTCCHPFHNELSRAERGGRPRLVFAGWNFDNDHLAGLLDLVAASGRPPGDDLLDRTGVVVIDDDPTGCVAAAHHLLKAVVRPEAIVPVRMPPELPPACGAFTAATLLPAAIIGIDVVRILEGAVALNTRFAEAPAETNPVAFSAGFLAGNPAGRPLRCRETARLEPLTAWWTALREAVVPWRPDPMAPPADIAIGQPRRDSLLDPSGVPWPVRSAEASGAATIVLPRLDEHAVGQLLQMLLIATVLERNAAPSPPR